ncbi:PQQ-dependent sugar dehydrogenase [Paenibacillus sp. GCM10027629]|uniref:PQQ-dependent sugar dehydrogenase n=1 Tax=Paenibacillus sp. GCM10027629 TaxID=3273414 RepID=UPI00363EEA26
MKFAAIGMLLLTLVMSSCTREARQEHLTRQVENQTELPYRVEVAADHLDVPWEMDVAKDARIFIAERSGRVRVMVDDQLLPEPVINLAEDIHQEAESGLLGLVLDPNFEQNRYFYVYHTYDKNGALYNRVLRLKEQNNRATVDRILLDGLGGGTSGNHNGGRIKIGPDGKLYVTMGEQYQPELAQDPNVRSGKILRINLDGSIPADNPVAGSPMYSMGHRNPQGIAWHPETGRLYASEHGQSAHDEINLIEAGANYGWPVIEGDETSLEHPAFKMPIIHSGDETWAPSGITFVSQGPWKGQLLVANLRGQQVLSMTLDDSGEKVANVQSLFRNYGRIRNVYEAPGGVLYFMTNNRDGRGNPQEGDDKLIRLVPKG